MKNSLEVSVISPKSTLFEGLAGSISSVNSAGKFDILPEHANFMTLISDQPIIIRPTAGSKPIQFSFKVAIIYAFQNKVKIYTLAAGLGFGISTSSK